MIKFADAVEHELRTTVIQAVEVAPGKFGNFFKILDCSKMSNLVKIKYDVCKHRKPL